jgi:hypothetical protein
MRAQEEGAAAAPNLGPGRAQVVFDPGTLFAPSARGNRPKGRRNPMLWTIFAILLVLWFLGLVTGYTLSGFIHILLVVAIAILLIRLIQGRSVA